VGGGGADVEFGGAVVLEGAGDAAVAGAGVQGGRDAGGGAGREVLYTKTETTPDGTAKPSSDHGQTAVPTATA
jgi:hypothetical protein